MKKLIARFDALPDWKRASYTILPLVVALFWLMPWFMERNYRLMKYVGERIERVPGPTTTSE